MLSDALYKAAPIHPALKESVRLLPDCIRRVDMLIDGSSKGHEAVANDGMQVTCTAFSVEQELVWAGMMLVSPFQGIHSILCAHRRPSQDSGFAMTQQGLSSLQMLQQASI